MTKIYTPAQLLSRVRQLPDTCPISDRIMPPRAYPNHKAHWIGWLREYDGPGAYSRSDYCRRNDARLVYNRVQNVGMVVWLAEAAGVDPNVVHGAVLKAQSARGNAANQTAAARKVLPWPIVVCRIFR